MTTGAGGVRAGKAFVELGVRDRFSAALRSAQRELHDYGASIRNVGAAVAGIGASVVAGFAATSVAFARTSSRLADMSARTGAGVEALQELGYAGGQVGVELEQIEAALRNQSRVVAASAAGSSEAAKALDSLGVSAASLKGLSPEEIFVRLGDALGGIDDETRRAAAAMKVFGKSGTSILPLFADGAAGLDRMREEARRFALVMDRDTVQAGDRLDDTMARLRATTRALSDNIGAAVAPAFTELADSASRVVAVATRFVRENRGLAVTALQVAAGVTAAGTAVAALGVGMIGLSLTITSVTTVVGALGATLGVVLSPAGLAAAAALGAASVAAVLFQYELGDLWDVLRDGIDGVVAEFAPAMATIGDSLRDGDLAGAAEVAMAAVDLAFAMGISSSRERLVEFSSWVHTTFAEIAAGATLAFDGVTTLLARVAVHGFGAPDGQRSAITGAPALFGAPAGQRSAITGDPSGLLGGDTTGLLGGDTAAILAALDADLERRRADAGRSLIEVDAERNAALEAARNSSRAQVEAARAALEEARLRSEAARFGPPGSLAGSDPAARSGRGAGDRLEAAADELALRIRDVGSRGVFGASSGSILSLQQPGNSTDDEIAKSSAETARHTRTIADAVRTGGLAFE